MNLREVMLVVITCSFLAPSLDATAQSTSDTPAITPVIPDLSSEQTKEHQVRSSYWNLGLRIDHHRLTSDGYDPNVLSGNATVLSIGRGHLSSRWFLSGALEVILGPYEAIRPEEIDTDFFGTGFNLLIGLSFNQMELRQRGGGYGIAMGLSYWDMTGRSLRTNRGLSSMELPMSPKSGLMTADMTYEISDYTMRITALTVDPSLFYIWLRDGRPEGNTPELLTTRIEGFLLQFGVHIPLMSGFVARFDTRQLKPDDSPTVPERESGSLKGLSLFLSASALFGI